MAHIAKCIVDMDANHTIKPASQSTSDSQTPSPSEKPFSWRMQQPDPQRKYQFFPKERKLPVLNSSKTAELDKPAPTGSTDSSEKTDKSSTANPLKKILNQGSLIRRRKISVPEIGPMTTVQEVSMDSPTIPGRPPFHERSISAPGDTSRKHQLAETFLYISSGDENPSPRFPEHKPSKSQSQEASPASPKQLAPLVIPTSDASLRQLRRQQSLNCFPTPVDSARMPRTNRSPRNRTPYTPNSSMPDLTTPKSASTNATCTTLPTPVSAPIMEHNTASPQPLDGGQIPPIANTELNSAFKEHRRGGSESPGMMDRGRPRKRPDTRNANGPIIQRTESKRSKSSEKKAFERLPSGLKPADAAEQLTTPELEMLQKQAFGQVERFEVLKALDVEMLSKELRHLDERTEYLRRTYNALRVGRRNLHSRICQYLRSPRVAKFSHESMLKQEEALAELDASIDDWVSKLEHAENRRTRVRQKLLEHVAAAACLPIGTFPSPEPAQETQMIVPSSNVGNISTPPRSPAKQSFTSSRSTSNSPSPQRATAHVPSTILEHPVAEEAMAGHTEEETKDQPPLPAVSLKRADVESIRIYAGDDVYTLLADVEDEITRMSKYVTESAPVVEVGETRRIALNRQRSHEMLNGLAIQANTAAKKNLGSATRSASLAPLPRNEDNSPMSEEPPILLSNTVYRP